MCANRDCGSGGMTTRTLVVFVIATLVVVFSGMRVEAKEATPPIPVPSQEDPDLVAPPQAPAIIPLKPMDTSVGTIVPAVAPQVQNDASVPVEPVVEVQPVGETTQPAMNFDDEALVLVPWEKSKTQSSMESVPQTKKWYRIGGYAGIGIGVLALGVSVWQGGISRSAQIDFATANTQVEIMRAKRRGEVAGERANAWLIGGGTLLGVSSALLIWTW